MAILEPGLERAWGRPTRVGHIRAPRYNLVGYSRPVFFGSSHQPKRRVAAKLGRVGAILPAKLAVF